MRVFRAARIALVKIHTLKQRNLRPTVTIRVVQQQGITIITAVGGLRRAVAVQRSRCRSLDRDAVIRGIRRQAAVSHQLRHGVVAAGRSRRCRRR